MSPGFLYASHASRAHDAASVGAVLRNADRRPPWLIVDHTVGSVIVSQWPGRLFEVEVVDPVGPEDLAAVKQPGLLPGAGYTRAVAVRVLAELEAAKLFGEHGAAVVDVLERARRLSLEGAQLLADADDPRAGRCYSNAWNAWLQAEKRGDSIHAGQDHARTLEIPARQRAPSPIGHGLSVVYQIVRHQAQQVGGEAALLIDEDGESRLAPPWDHAADALLHAVMALGAPRLVSQDDRRHLLRAWEMLERG
ncbi:MAG: hypothetical protein QM765_31120 [Myxococcales bacterium]